MYIFINTLYTCIYVKVSTLPNMDNFTSFLEVKASLEIP